jgi:hypothetical protein
VFWLLLIFFFLCSFLVLRCTSLSHHESCIIQTKVTRATSSPSELTSTAARSYLGWFTGLITLNSSLTLSDNQEAIIVEIWRAIGRRKLNLED